MGKRFRMGWFGGILMITSRCGQLASPPLPRQPSSTISTPAACIPDWTVSTLKYIRLHPEPAAVQEIRSLAFQQLVTRAQLATWLNLTFDTVRSMVRAFHPQRLHGQRGALRVAWAHQSLWISVPAHPPASWLRDFPPSAGFSSKSPVTLQLGSEATPAGRVQALVTGIRQILAQPTVPISVSYAVIPASSRLLRDTVLPMHPLQSLQRHPCVPNHPQMALWIQQGRIPPVHLPWA